MAKHKGARGLAGWGILAALILFFSAASPKFFTLSNLVTVLRQVSLLGIAAVGLMYVMLTGCMDLSVGAQMSLSGMVLAVCMSGLGLPLWACVLLALASGALTGYLNGLVVTLSRIPSLLATLATTSIFSGLSYLVSGGNPIYNIQESFLFLGQGHILGVVPVPVLILACILGASAFLQGRTYLGKYVCAVGSNAYAAKAAGLNIRRIRRATYLLCGLLAALAGIIMVSRVNSAQPSAGLSYQLNTLAACAVGGVSMRGGKGRVADVITGILIMGVLTNGLGIIGTSKYLQNVIQGLVFLLAMGLDYARRETPEPERAGEEQ